MQNKILEFLIKAIKTFLLQEDLCMQMIFDHLIIFSCPRNSTCNSSTYDESEEWQVAQDAEISLLKSGEIM